VDLGMTNMAEICTYSISRADANLAHVRQGVLEKK